jgi:protein required for attachment to host cells
MASDERARAVWIAVTDNRWGRLFRCHRTPTGGWRAEEPETIRSAWEEHRDGHGAPPPGAPDAGPPQHMPSLAHKKEEETRRFAHEVAAWLEARTRERGIDHLTVFAPDHFLGPLRASWPPRLRPLVTEHADARAGAVVEGVERIHAVDRTRGVRRTGQGPVLPVEPDQPAHRLALVA